MSYSNEILIGWFNRKTGNWDKEKPDLPAFVIENYRRVMLTCEKCGGTKWVLYGQLYDSNGNVVQQSYQCENPKCGHVMTPEM